MGGVSTIKNWNVFILIPKKFFPLRYPDFELPFSAKNTGKFGAEWKKKRYCVRGDISFVTRKEGEKLENPSIDIISESQQ